MFKVRRALVSVSDKSDLIPFVKGLADLGAEILSTGGTAKQLRDAGIDAVDVSDRPPEYRKRSPRMSSPSEADRYFVIAVS